MFTVYHSNQIDVLKSLLVELIRLSPLENPFEKEQILVQSPGMSQWLKIELAKEFGVAANLDFPLPATFIWTLFTQVLPDVPKRSAFNKEAMTWKLMQLLPAMLEHADFAPLKRYLEDDKDDTKRYQLAEKIADIFDGYLVYRPEWIAAWEAGQEVAELNNEHPWQPQLWQALYDQTISLGQSPYHRANLYEHFIEALADGRLEHAQLPKRLFVFGISSLPPRYLDALKVIGAHIDVHLMFTNPSRYYWGEVRDRKYLAKLAARHRQHRVWQQDHSEVDGESPQLKGTLDDNLADALHTDVVGNSLLASMGKLGRDNLYLLSQLESHEIEAFVDVERDSLLHQLQADILNLEEHQDDSVLDSSHHKRQVTEQDRSLSVHACHSPMREVEVLHDQLLAMFDADPTLKPRDVIVMVADINAYSPAIQAVFGNAPGERFIPYSISDRSADQESPILTAFMQLVNLPQARCLASELLELLETPAMMARFGIDEQEFELAKVWVEQSGIRWGLNATTAEEFALPSRDQNTWQFGIERMLLGYAMPDSAGLFSQKDHELAPYNEVQGMSAELAGKLAHYIESISRYRQRLAQTQTIDNWQTTLLVMLDDFFMVALEEELVLTSIREALTQLKEQLQDAAYHQTLAPGIVSLYLHNRLSGTRVSQRFLAGQVNFCTLMPMRSIPFRCVCLLGMNDGVYPRSVPPEGFDLMNGRARAGDRSRRDDDRYLFLEALLSAQQSLYISYVGRSIQDNTERVPSVLVSELLEYCQQNYCLVGDEALPVDDSAARLLTALTLEHAMVPFSPLAFQGEQASYAREWLPAALRQGQRSGDFNRQLSDYLLDATYPLALDLVELQRFWRLPVRYFFNRRLKVVFEPPLPVTEDDEPFVLGGLESYQMRDQLVEVLLDARAQNQDPQQALEYFARRQRAEGKLPIGAFGELEFETNRVQAQELVETLSFVSGVPLEDVDVNLTFDVLGADKPVHLTGWLTQCYQAGLIRYRSGRIRAQDYLSAWIDHLSLAAMGHSKSTHVIGYDRKEGAVHFMYPPLDGAEAKSLLAELVRLYYQGMTAPLAYFPQTALAGIEAGFSRGKWVDDEDKAVKKMAATFNDGYLVQGEGRDPYIARIWPQWDDALALEVRTLSALVLQNARLRIENAADS
ncbi:MULTISPECIES: exodeoxyribonuclease V subunit gamma [unclassified Vibrio]|uniref:exodeoxyribonuclease V subunit gamma n=1 Tax=unclassified Vibrio TaxID=2614977 RepID=UPI00136149E1|nr:exodeoxyribonuclease V subunit gamma [Vibrio sp. V36_P2S2PM302]NAX26820.1 exodeoxyribonuclease V subunit gamma [Vibrio sp. V38_P2S17PM301]NAX29755.1 exodeoxyribonuclease V subunit gamma [Vibrio sp. V37_P2S8PM304]